MALRRLAVAAGLSLVSVSLQGCGSKSDDNNKPATTLPVTTTTLPATTTTTTRVPAKSMFPIRGVSYEVLPGLTVDPTIGRPPDDFMQVGYSAQWGKDGRDDLGLISSLGGNAVRVYQGFGLDTHDHSAFLDRAAELNLNVMVGFHTAGAICDDFNCFQTWKTMTSDALQKAGFAKDGAWHPAVKMLVLMDEPDNLNFFKTASDTAPQKCGSGGTPTPTGPEQAKCRVRAVLSALEGLLSAEADAGIDGSQVNITVAWSFDNADSIDGVVTQAVGIWGFQDTYAGVNKPSLADYTPQTKMDLAKVYGSRWVHSLNVPSIWSFVKEKVHDTFSGAQYSTRPWFIAGYQPPTGEDVKGDLTDMASSIDSSFVGVTFRGFQKDLLAGTPWGLYSLGDKKLGDCKPCQTDVSSGRTDCNTFPVQCLDASKGTFLNDVVAAWGGKSSGAGLCDSQVEAVVV